MTDLEGRGAIFVDELDEVPDGATVVFSAHGVSPEVRAGGRASAACDAIDATCPLVAKVHAEARRFAAEGYQVALIGHAGHEEVEGTLGEAPQAMTLVETAGGRGPAAAGGPGQGRLPDADHAVRRRGRRHRRTRCWNGSPPPAGPGSDDICYATTNRQLAVRAIAAESDLVLVAGSANSSNSRAPGGDRGAGRDARLPDRRAGGHRARLARGGVGVGLTAGASAPPAVVDQIIDALSGLGPVEVSERVVATEIHPFGLPKEVEAINDDAVAPERARRDAT